MAKFGTVEIPATGAVLLSGARRNVLQAKLTAHPSNSGVIYVKNTTDSGNGYPLGAGASLDIGSSNLFELTASGVVGGRLAYAYSE